MSVLISPQKYNERLSKTILYSEAGKITKTLGLLYEAYLPGASIGSICDIVLNENSIHEPLHQENTKVIR